MSYSTQTVRELAGVQNEFSKQGPSAVSGTSVYVDTDDAEQIVDRNRDSYIDALDVKVWVNDIPSTPVDVDEESGRIQLGVTITTQDVRISFASSPITTERVQKEIQTAESICHAAIKVEYPNVPDDDEAFVRAVELQAALQLLIAGESNRDNYEELIRVRRTEIDAILTNLLDTAKLSREQLETDNATSVSSVDTGTAYFQAGNSTKYDWMTDEKREYKWL